jgi:hypothetical protein
MFPTATRLIGKSRQSEVAVFPRAMKTAFTFHLICQFSAIGTAFE